MEKTCQSVRKTAVAGSFYPASRMEIEAFIECNLPGEEGNNDLRRKAASGAVSGLIVPHAGWMYSGETAIRALQLLRLIKPDRIALLGPSHYHPVDTVYRDKHDCWETPLGRVQIIEDNHFKPVKQFHAEEHALEVQMPFIRFFSPESKVLPLVIGSLGQAVANEVAQQLAGTGYFLIVSTDLSHFLPEALAREKDRESIRKIESLQASGVDACGVNPLKVAVEYCKLRNTRPKLIAYTTSAESTGNVSSVVGYASFWF